MPFSYRSGGRTLILRSTLCALFLALSFSPSRAAQHQPLSPFDKAQRLREGLEGRPEQQRTRRDYERVLAAYRAVYHGDPGSPKADASISAVADLLAEQGRIFQDEKSLHDAIGQYEFLRKQYT
jgi:N-acetylmuramoyl-L-alanine amidase